MVKENFAVSMDEFEQLLNESFGIEQNLEGTVVKGTVLAIERDFVIIDVGLKTEGRIELKEFIPAGSDKPSVKPGDTVDVYVERYENARGEVALSRDKARREEAWTNLEKSHTAGEQVEGIIFSRVKGGFTVDLDGAIAFLPGSQVDVRPIRDISSMMNIPQKFMILKMDYRRGNIVVSRRAILEEERAGQRAEFVESMKEGMIVDGIVKNITDYGAFIDLGGIDGLLHVTDISWKRINHPSEVLTLGTSVKVQITKISPENHRLSLGMKQLEADPWEGIEERLSIGSKHNGKVISIADYGAFIELSDNVEGLIHVTELSWTKKNIQPNKVVSDGDIVEVVVLEIDKAKRRISLGMKQCTPNPWTEFAQTHPVGSDVEGEVRSITEFGLFIAVTPELDGMVHINDISWKEQGEVAIKNHKKGEVIKARILEIDADKERIALGIKQLEDDPFATSIAGIKKGDQITCIVKEVLENGIEVTFGSDATAFIKKGELSRDRSEQRPNRFAIGDKVDAKVTNLDRSNRSVTLSIKALEIEEEKDAVAQYGSTDSGASLGDILGAALKAKQESIDTDNK